MSSVRIGRNENGVLSATWSDDFQRALGRVDRFSAEVAGKFAQLKVPSLSASQLDDLFPLAASRCRFLDDEGHRKKGERKHEIETDFRLFVDNPAMAQFPACEISTTVLAALIADLSNEGRQFRWISGQSSFRALCEAVAAKAGVSPATLDKVFPDKPELFSTKNEGFKTIFPRHEYGYLLFNLAVWLVRCGRVLAFGERHGRVVHLEGTLFENEGFHIPGFSGPSWVEQIKVFSPLRFIGAKEATDQFSGRLGPRSKNARLDENRAKEVIRLLAAAQPRARMTKTDAIAALKGCDFGSNAAERIWDGAAPAAWKVAGRIPSGGQRLCSDDLTAALNSHP